MSGRIPPNKPAGGAAASGGSIALYGVFMRDNLQNLRGDISKSIDNIQSGLNTLSPSDKAEAQKALKNMNSALNKLKFVSPMNWGSGDTTKNAIGPAASGGATALYGVFVNQKLNAYKTEINGLISEINRGVKTNQFNADETKEAQAAKASLQKALADLK